MLHVATHDGVFHADEVMACAVIRAVHPDTCVHITRTRDPKGYERADIVLDVGGVYNPAARRFDHHQRGFDLVRQNGHPYATAGLVWKEFGPVLCPDFAVWQEIDSALMEGIDAVDCGTAKRPPKGSPRTMSLSEVISGYNPPITQQEDAHFDADFIEAVEFAYGLLQRTIERAEANRAADALVRDACAQAGTSTVVELPQYLPWKQGVHVHAPTALYVVWPARDQWWLAAVPADPGSFTSKKPLPSAWCGLEGEALCEALALPDAVFCHRGGFIAAAKSRESVMEMARRALAV